MIKQFGKSLFGYKPSEVLSEIERLDGEYQQKVNELKKEIEKANAELAAAVQKQDHIQTELNSYVEREKLIADVMVKAQINAQKIEEQAREKARMMLENTEEELKNKLQELDFLRLKVARFKDEFREVLDNYRVSLENVREMPEDISFTPTLVVKDKFPESNIS